MKPKREEQERLEAEEQPRYAIENPGAFRLKGRLHSEKARAHGTRVDADQISVPAVEKKRTRAKKPTRVAHGDAKHRLERLRDIPYEIREAHRNGDHHAKASLYGEKATHLDVLREHQESGEFLILTRAHGDAATHAEAADDKVAALHHYRRALHFLIRTVEARAERKFGFAANAKATTEKRLQAILDGIPDARERQRRELKARMWGILDVGEEYREPEVNVDAVRREIQRLEQGRQDDQKEDDFLAGELGRMEKGLAVFRGRIRSLEKALEEH